MAKADGLPVKIQRIALFSDDGQALVPTYGFGDRVNIDGGDVVGTVIGVAVYPHGAVTFNVSWWANGLLYDQWIAEWRLSKASPHD
jgi:hypothetical protein